MRKPTPRTAPETSQSRQPLRRYPLPLAHRPPRLIPPSPELPAAAAPPHYSSPRPSEASQAATTPHLARRLGGVRQDAVVTVELLHGGHGAAGKGQKPPLQPRPPLTPPPPFRPPLPLRAAAVSTNEAEVLERPCTGARTAPPVGWRWSCRAALKAGGGGAPPLHVLYTNGA